MASALFIAPGKHSARRLSTTLPENRLWLAL
jgi:hypothetical protein